MPQLYASTFHLFNLGGHSVQISPTYGFLILLTVSAPGRSLPDALAVVFAISISILWHELGHATAFQRYRCGPSDIILHGFGGQTMNQLASRLTRGEAIKVSAAGPLAGLLLGALCFGAFYLYEILVPDERTLLDVFLWWMVLINFVWSIFNLLPIYPMDGGQIFYRFIAKYSADPALVTAIVAGCLIAPLMALAIFSTGDHFLAAILGLQGFESYQLYARTRSFGPR